MKNNPFAFFVHQLEEKLPAPLSSLQIEIKEITRRVMQDKLSQFDFVSREQWLLQQTLLVQAQEKIRQLETRLLALENR